MSRPLRIEIKDGFYHVMAHGNGRQWIYSNPKHVKIFQDVLKQVVAKYHVHIHGAVLMRNHYHLLIDTPEANLTRAIQRLNTMYATRFNFLSKRKGSVFRPHYRAILIEKEEYYMRVVNYISQNPVRAGGTRRCEDYEGSFLNWLLTDDSVLQYIYVNELKEYFGDNRNTWLNNLLKIVNSSSVNTREFEHLKTNLLGGQRWKEKIARQLPDLSSVDISNKRSYNSLKCSKGKIELVVNKTKVSNKLNLKIYLLFTYTQMSLAKISETLGLKSSAAVSQRLYRIRKKLEEDSKFYEKISRIAKSLKC